MSYKFLLLPLCLLSSTSWAGESLRLPTPLQPETVLSPKQLHDAIVTAANEREWRVLSDKPGVIELEVAPRTHKLSVAVRYSPQQVAVSYKNSTDLDYVLTEGVATIHGAANSWMLNLMDSIHINLLRATPLSR